MFFLIAVKHENYMKLQKLMEICEDAHLAFIITLKITSRGLAYRLGTWESICWQQCFEWRANIIIYLPRKHIHFDSDSDTYEVGK